MQIVIGRRHHQTDPILDALIEASPDLRTYLESLNDAVADRDESRDFTILDHRVRATTGEGTTAVAVRLEDDLKIWCSFPSAKRARATIEISYCGTDRDRANVLTDQLEQGLPDTLGRALGDAMPAMLAPYADVALVDFHWAFDPSSDDQTFYSAVTLDPEGVRAVGGALPLAA